MKKIYILTILIFLFYNFSFSQITTNNKQSTTKIEQKKDYILYSFPLYGLKKEKIAAFDKEFGTRSGILFTKTQMTKENMGIIYILCKKNITPDDILSVLDKKNIRTKTSLDDYTIKYLTKEEYQKEIQNLKK